MKHKVLFWIWIVAFLINFIATIGKASLHKPILGGCLVTLGCLGFAVLKFIDWKESTTKEKE